MVMSRSFTPFGGHVNLPTSAVFTAKPTPASRRSSLHFTPKEGATFSHSWPSLASRVSLRAAISLYLVSSLPIRSEVCQHLLSLKVCAHSMRQG